MRKFLKITLVIVIIAAVLLGIVLSVFKFFIPLYNYSTAKSNLKSGNYEVAYNYFEKCNGFNDSEDYLHNFAFVYEKETEKLYDSSGKFAGHYNRQLDKNGNLTLVTFYDRNGKFSSKTTYRYDKNGNLVYENFYFGGGTAETVKYNYDDNNNLIEEAHYDVSNKVTSKFTHKYDNNGRKTNTVEYSNHDSEYELFYAYEYDENGFLICQKILNSFGQETGSYEFINDERGNKICDTYYSVSGIQGPYKEYKYDSYNNVIYAAFYDGQGNFAHKHEEEYNSHGDQISYTLYASENEIYEKTTYTIKYDQYGNKTSRITYINGKKSGRSVSEYQGLMLVYKPNK